jgi:hypothetical protein
MLWEWTLGCGVLTVALGVLAVVTETRQLLVLTAVAGGAGLILLMFAQIGDGD